jgi:hypothetical protein
MDSMALLDAPDILYDAEWLDDLLWWWLDA